MAAIEKTVKGFRDRSVGLQEIDRGQGRMVGDQVGGVNHDVGAGTGKDRTRVGDGAGVEGKVGGFRSSKIREHSVQKPEDKNMLLLG